MSLQDKSYHTFSEALRQVWERPQLETRLSSEDTKCQAREELKIDEDMAQEILITIMALKQVETTPNVQGSALEKHQEIETDRDLLFESFQQLRTAYRTSITMSVVVFAIGVAFLVIAVIRSFTDPQSIIMTSVIGGIGVLQLVSLFYSNPLLHIARTVSLAQQAKIAVISYLIGIDLLHEQTRVSRPTDAHLNNLIHLTQRSLEQLRAYAEDGETKAQTTQFPSSDQLVNKVGQE